jgi:hypothetical protein
MTPLARHTLQVRTTRRTRAQCQQPGWLRQLCLRSSVSQSERLMTEFSIKLCCRATPSEAALLSRFTTENF